MSRAIVFIDGNNFYHKLRKLTDNTDGPLSLLDFDYTNFFLWLIKPNILQEARYYIGALKRRKGNANFMSCSAVSLCPRKVRRR